MARPKLGAREAPPAPAPRPLGAPKAGRERERERERERKRERKRKREREREAGREGERSHSLPNQDNAFSLRVVEEKFNAVLVVCSIEGVAANSDAR